MAGVQEFSINEASADTWKRSLDLCCWTPDERFLQLTYRLELYSLASRWFDGSDAFAAATTRNALGFQFCFGVTSTRAVSIRKQPEHIIQEWNRTPPRCPSHLII